ncbi:MAG: hypothetical protein MHMPM18_001342 [Marteilia pararefringens]
MDAEESKKLANVPHGDDDHGEMQVVGNEDTEMTSTERTVVLVATFLCYLLFPLTCLCMFQQIKQTERGLIFRFGKLKSLEPLFPGLNVVIPGIEELKTVDIRSQVLDVPPQRVITKDMVPLTVDAVILSQTFDPIKATTRVKDIHYTIKNLAQIHLRNLLGSKTMKEIMVAKASLSQAITANVSVIASKWGVEIQNIELQEIQLPKDLQASMAVEAEAQRQANAKILSAEGEKKSALLLKEAADEMGGNSNTMMLRVLQTLSSMNNPSTIIFPIPFDITKLFNPQTLPKAKTSKSNKKQDEGEKAE